MKCENCKYFHYEELKDEGFGDSKILECRRYAPREICGTGTGYSNQKFPNIKKDDWCGEFEKKGEKENG